MISRAERERERKTRERRDRGTERERDRTRDREKEQERNKQSERYWGTRGGRERGESERAREMREGCKKKGRNSLPKPL